MKMEEKNTKLKREDVCPGKKGKLDLETLRAQERRTNGPEYWRSLEELAGSADFQEDASRISQRRIRVGGFCFTPRLSEGDGRIAWRWPA